ncbi:MAG: DUF1634 domain-containing protein [Armatimonadota bacterium]|nr:DUF1634 domain-containing protein [Armatimonadota bacterium]
MSGILLAGVATSALVVAIGLILLIPAGTGKRLLLEQLTSEHEVYIAGLPHTLGAVLAGAVQGRPVAVILLGLLLLIATPIVRVLVAAAYFAFTGDCRYALISTGVLLLLLLGFVLGRAT